MVFDNVLKLHGTRSVPGLVALGVLTTAVVGPVGCGNDKFSGCEASRTCPPKGDDSGAGGEAGGSGADSGGSSGSGTSGSGNGGTNGSGTGGTAGTSDMGGAGAGGSGEDTEPPTLVSFTPEDGDEEVERNVTVTAELSEPIDEATVTRSSVTLEGPDGEVSGSLSVDANVISFIADQPLTLLGMYTFTLHDAVSDLAGNALVENVNAQFQVRDGRWASPTHPFGTTPARSILRAKGNALGDIVIGMVTSPMPDAVYGAVYEAASNEWTPAIELRRTTGAQYFVPGLGVDSSRRSIVAWQASGGDASWSHFGIDGSWTSAGPLPSSVDLVVTPMGSGLAVYAIDALTSGAQTINLSSGTLGPEETISVPDITSHVFPVVSLERQAVIWSRINQTSGRDLVVTWKGSSSWGTPEPIATAPDISSFALDSDEQGNIIVVWRETEEVWSSIYERAREAWTSPQFVATTSTDGVVLTPDITAGNAIVAVNGRNPTDGMWAAIYQSGVGWIQSSITRLDDRELYSIGLSIDPAGNALAVWGPELRYRRYVAGIGWQAASALDANVDAGSVSGAGAPDGSVLVVATDFEANPNGAPMAVRFE